MENEQSLGVNSVREFWSNHIGSVQSARRFSGLSKMGLVRAKSSKGTLFAVGSMSAVGEAMGRIGFFDSPPIQQVTTLDVPAGNTNGEGEGGP